MWIIKSLEFEMATVNFKRPLFADQNCKRFNQKIIKKCQSTTIHWLEIGFNKILLINLIKLAIKLESLEEKQKWSEAINASINQTDREIERTETALLPCKYYNIS